MDNVIRKSEDIGVPVIAGIGLQQGEMLSLAEIFREEEYQTLLLAENPVDGKAIPLEHYSGKDGSWAQILYTVNKVYEPDIIFLDLCSNKIYCTAKESGIDVYINSEDKVYQIYADNLIGTTKDLKRICDIICQYFE